MGKGWEGHWRKRRHACRWPHTQNCFYPIGHARSRRNIHKKSSTKARADKREERCRWYLLLLLPRASCSSHPPHHCPEFANRQEWVTWVLWEKMVKTVPKVEEHEGKDGVCRHFWRPAQNDRRAIRHGNLDQRCHVGSLKYSEIGLISSRFERTIMF